jgi:ectoine hydroxylase-related dioxygenase (phytanoyl-CoA dioxygenase family)
MLAKYGIGTMHRDLGLWREAYDRDGAAVLRGVLPGEWIERMRAAVDRVINSPAPSAVEYTPAGASGRYVGDFFLWLRDLDFRALALESPLPRLAAEIMRSRSVTLFFDHLLVKEPRTAEETPWHQDLPYWPVRGSDILSLWVPLDEVTPECGAVVYRRASHRAGQLYAPRAFANDSGFADIYKTAGLPPVPDDLSNCDPRDLLVWTTEPGDVVVHHPLTLHHAPGNSSGTRRRRAIALRYLGDDAVYFSRPGNFLEKSSVRAVLPAPVSYREGGRRGAPNFPTVAIEGPRTAADTMEQQR